MLGDVDRVCPLLALAADRRSVVDGVDAGHACHAQAEPMPLERQQQAQLCLTPRHDRCERYLQHVARHGGTPGRVGVADGFVSTRMVLAPEPAWRGIAGRARRGRPGRVVAVGGAVLAASVAGAALARPALDGELSVLDAAVESPSASPSMLAAVTPEPSTPSPSPSPSPSPEATATASPTPTATPEPTLAPTAVPTPEPVRTYVVQEGDTLAALAQRFGTTVAALQAANDIEDPDEIIIGQTLVIP
jgi:LysM repeat protein